MSVFQLLNHILIVIIFKILFFFLKKNLNPVSTVFFNLSEYKTEFALLFVIFLINLYILLGSPIQQVFFRIIENLLGVEFFNVFQKIKFENQPMFIVFLIRGACLF